MKRNLSDYFVALSVIVCSLILLAALTIALSGFRLKKPTRTLQIDFEDVTGVKLHSEVRYAGAGAGRVIAMRHLSPEQREAAANKRNAVRVTVSLARRSSAVARRRDRDAELRHVARADVRRAFRRHARTARPWRTTPSSKGIRLTASRKSPQPPDLSSITPTS